MIGSTKGNGFSQHQLDGVALLTCVTKLDLSTPLRPNTAILYTRTLFAALVVLGKGDATDGDVVDGDVTDGDVTDGDMIDGDVTDEDMIDGDVADGDVTDGDMIDGDVTDGDVTDEDMIDGDVTDGDMIDGDVVDGDMIDGDVIDGDMIDGDVTDGEMNNEDVDGDLFDLPGREKFLAVPGCWSYKGHCRSYTRPSDAPRTCFGVSRRDSKSSVFPISCGSWFGVSHTSITPCVCGSVPSSLMLSRLSSPCSSRMWRLSATETRKAAIEVRRPSSAIACL